MSEHWDRGAATVLLVFMLGAVLVTVAAALTIARVAVMRAQLSTAADLSALAAAASGQCSTAESIGQSNGAERVLCEQREQDFVVRAESDLQVLAGRRVTIAALARAGPPE
jgi:secretion/DNA translocation related TadE-like protein